MAGAVDLPDVLEKELPMSGVNVKEKHDKAIELQKEIKLWMERNNFMVETGISYPERRLTIYLSSAERVKIQRGLFKRFPGIEHEVDFATLSDSSNRKRLTMYPGRTPVSFGDGSSATLGTFIRDRDNQTLYALTSQHSRFPVTDTDVPVQVFVKVDESMYRLGKIVADVKEPSPVVDACLLEVDIKNEEMYKKINFAMFFNNPKPPIYLKMYENAENLGLEDSARLQVSKYGYITEGTTGSITQYSRDLIEDGHLLTDNIVTVSENPDPVANPFAASGDSGSIVFRSVRCPKEKIFFHDAISMLYMADENTGECFSIPLPRCLSKLGEQIGCQLELATQNPGYHLNY